VPGQSDIRYHTNEIRDPKEHSEEWPPFTSGKVILFGRAWSLTRFSARHGQVSGSKDSVPAVPDFQIQEWSGRFPSMFIWVHSCFNGMVPAWILSKSKIF
jgi:hypothetical protein